jgi:hypothetical protein
LFFSLLEPVAQVGVDLFKTRHLSWVDPEEGAPDASVFVRTWGAVVAAADPEGDLPQLEITTWCTIAGCRA